MTSLESRIISHHGDSREVLKTISDCSIDSCVTDPPYALVSIVKRFGADNAGPAKSEGGSGVYSRVSSGFMGQKWDTGETAFDPAFWAEVLRVLKPGAHLVAFSGTRTYHRMVCAIEDAGFEIRDQLQWLYGSGFPKSHDVSKGIDKKLGCERTRVRIDAAKVRNPKAAGAGRDGARGAFHGRTLAAIAAGGQAKYLEGFGPKVEGFDQVPFADLAALKAAIGPETAALLIEPVQGEGGLRPVPTEFLRAMRQLCDDNGLLLIFDEIQTGVGRTGRLFAHEWSGVTPDIMTIAKGIGGGFPMGACLATERAARAMAPGSHASTFGGNPLAMAVGNAVLDVVLAPQFLPQVRKIAGFARQQLEGLVASHPAVFADVRGEGLMLGLKMKVPNADFVAALRGHHMLAVPAGDNVVRLLPPLNIEEDHVREAVALLDAAARDLEASGKTAA